MCGAWVGSFVEGARGGRCPAASHTYMYERNAPPGAGPVLHTGIAV